MAVDLELEGKYILVTGVTSGLGRSFVRALTSQGANVIGTGRRVERLEALKAELADAPGGFSHLSFDVTDIAAMNDAVEKAWEISGGSLWGLVNNSGVSNAEPIQDTTEDTYDWVMDTNTKSVFFLTQAVGKKFLQRGTGGRVVNIASIAGYKTLVGSGVYCISKAATEHLTKCFAREWARYDINVNAICPGFIETELNSEFFNSDAGVKYMNKFPRRRVGKETDLNELLMFLLSPTSGYVTGSAMIADDGQVLGG